MPRTAAVSLCSRFCSTAGMSAGAALVRETRNPVAFITGPYSLHLQTEKSTLLPVWLTRGGAGGFRNSTNVQTHSRRLSPSPRWWEPAGASLKDAPGDSKVQAEVRSHT